MKLLKNTRFAAVLLCLVWASGLALAQSTTDAAVGAVAATTNTIQQGESSLADIVAGKVAPLTFDLNNTPAGYMAFTLSSNDIFSVMAEAFSFGGSAPMSEFNSTVSKYMAASWTKGDTVEVFGQHYLIAYQYISGQNAATFGGNTSSPEYAKALDGFVANPVYGLVLIKASDVTKLAPLADITAENFAQLKAKGEKATPSQTVEISNLKQIALGTIMYTTDNDDNYPISQSTPQCEEAIYPYVKNRTIFKSINPNGGAIQFNVKLAGVNETAIPNPAGFPIWFDSVPWPDGTRVVAFADGHVKSVSADEWGLLLPMTLSRPKFAKTAKSVKADFPNLHTR